MRDCEKCGKPASNFTVFGMPCKLCEPCRQAEMRLLQSSAGTMIPAYGKAGTDYPTGDWNQDFNWRHGLKR